jgi:hypothetical protein
MALSPKAENGCMPKITYALQDDSQTVEPGGALWRERLPLRRPSVGEPERNPLDAPITYGIYFEAVRSFLERRGGIEALAEAASQRLGRPVAAGELQDVCICLEKHGEYTHPARLSVRCGRRRLAFVVNAAFKEPGKQFLRQDFANLARLRAEWPYRFVPAVYHQSSVTLGGFAPEIDLFLGEWLEGFQEFHLTGQPAKNNSAITVWGPRGARSLLADAQRQQIYRRAAAILTAYFNLQTFEQIFAWHHAAGDFVIKAATDPLELRLVTVRRYAPLFEAPPGADSVLQALLVFGLNLSLRMRLDRIDGVGTVAWAHEDAVAPSLQGVFEGLNLQANCGRIPKGLAEGFLRYLRQFAADDLSDLLAGIAARGIPRPDENRIVRRHLARHAAAFRRAAEAQTLSISTT